MKHSGIALGMVVAVLATACAGPRAAPPAATAGAVAGAPMQLQTPPVHALIGHRERLDLTSEQINALDSIGIWIQEENREHLAELRGLMGAGRMPGRGGAVPANEATLALLQQIDENNRSAVAGVQSLLTPEQQTGVCAIFRDSPGRGGAPPAAARGAAAGRPPARGAAAAGAAPRTPWTWCAPPAEGESPSEEATPGAESPVG